MVGTRNRQCPRVLPPWDNVTQPAHDGTHCRRARWLRSLAFVYDSNRNPCCARQEKYDQKLVSYLAGCDPRRLDSLARCFPEPSPEKQVRPPSRPSRRENAVRQDLGENVLAFPDLVPGSIVRVN